MLLNAAEPVPVETEVEFSLVLQGSEPAGLGQVAGRGRVVRITTPDERPEPGFAVAIDDYTFFHTPAQRSQS